MSDARSRADRPGGLRQLVVKLFGLTLAGLLALAPATVMAQATESPSPTESPLPTEAAASFGPDTVPADAFDLIPAELAGTPVDPENVAALRGQEIIELNPAAAEAFQAVAEATGTRIDDMMQVSAYVEPADGELVFFGFIQVPRADAVAVLEVLLPITLESMEQPRVETVEIGGRSVTVIHEDASLAAPPTNLIPVDDILWIVQGDEVHVPGVIEQLPG